MSGTKRSEKTNQRGIYDLDMITMGLSDAPVSCQCLTEMVLNLPSGFRSCFHLELKHLQHLVGLPSTFHSHGLKLNPSKWYYRKFITLFLLNAPFQWTQDDSYLTHARSDCLMLLLWLAQWQGHQEKYASHVLTQAERKWSTYNRGQCLPVTSDCFVQSLVI